MNPHISRAERKYHQLPERTRRTFKPLLQISNPRNRYFSDIETHRVYCGVTRRDGTEHLVELDELGAMLLMQFGLSVNVNPVRSDRPDEFYARVRAYGQNVMLHRFLFDYMVDSDRPELDHVNGNGLDNRFQNIRAANRCEQMNNTRKQRANLT